LIYPKGYIKSHAVEQFLEFLKIYPFEELLRGEVDLTRKRENSVSTVESVAS